MATIEINGKKFEAENGKMIIEVADEANIHIPRFCYHKKLSIAANCRMCLVELEGSRKTVPACATPITDGMKVFTQSPAAICSQQAVMDFLLINHPLDCPICDQGGECELQDVSMGFGHSTTSYEETKRAVDGDNLGPLIATEMTRCIHCTRCVRFGDEIAGLPELGGIGRGEDVKISTYVEHSMQSEISANIIDLCPVGALTSKPYRYTARPWEMTQHEGVAPHDCLGSNVYFHTRRNQLMRVVPKEHEAINETWLSDRDRFSYLGLNSKERAASPMIKTQGQWMRVDWQTALNFAAEGMKKVIDAHGASEFAALASASATVEEYYLLQKLMRALNVQNIDHRLQQTDFRDDTMQPLMPTSSIAYAELEQQDVILIIGSQLTREVPLAGVRLRKAQNNGALIYSINSVQDDLYTPMTDTILVSPEALPKQLGCIVLALLDKSTEIPHELQSLLLGLKPDERIVSIANALRQSKACIITGALFENHPHASVLRTLVMWIETLSNARCLRLTTGANSAGAWAAGMLPHRAAAGHAIDSPGLNTQAALDAKLKGYFLLNVEPGYDCSNPYHARQSMLAAEFVVVMSGFSHESIQEYADVILPIGLYAETSGTYVNLDKTWQTVKGAITPPGEARPAWKVLRVLGNLFKVHGFDFDSTEDVLDALKAELTLNSEPKPTWFYPDSLPTESQQLVRIGEWPLYRNDSVVRHAKPLQATAKPDYLNIRIHPVTADSLQLGDVATVSQGDIEITLPLKRDERVAQDVVWIANAMPETVDLGHAFAAITIKR
jgi:NADH-quinone oxidoreductase subunit G